MHFINSVNSKSGVKVMVLLLIISFCIMGFYSVTSGAPGVTYGDVTEDGEIDVRDVVWVMQHILELRTLTDEQLKAADVNDDGVVDVRDVTLIMQYVLGLIDEFPTRGIVESVEAIEINVAYGTKYDDIDFPETVKATLDDDSEEDIEVDWDENSDPEYSPRSAKDYVFEGTLVNLPSGIGNPDGVKAKATVTVYLPWKTLPPDVVRLPSEYDFEVYPGKDVYEDENVDAAYYVYAEETYTLEENDYLYNDVSPADFVYGDEKVLFDTVTVGNFGYDDVMFQFEVDKSPGNDNGDPEEVFFKVISGQNAELEVEGDKIVSKDAFDLPRDYSASWQIMFADDPLPGYYEITFKLVYEDTKEVVAQTKRTFGFYVIENND